MKVKRCNWCDNSFETEISYKIYCSEECRNAATKEKIANRYLITRRSSTGRKNRKCKQCGSRLSIYNDDSLCQNCLINPKDVSKALKDMKDLFNDK